MVESVVPLFKNGKSHVLPRIQNSTTHHAAIGLRLREPRLRDFCAGKR